ncbi:hypothetical protein ANTQUA_LOCUS1411 [Anthophora quadrimaculata]
MEDHRGGDVRPGKQRGRAIKFVPLHETLLTLLFPCKFTTQKVVNFFFVKIRVKSKKNDKTNIINENVTIGIKDLEDPTTAELTNRESITPFSEETVAIWKVDTVNVSTRHVLCRIAASFARIMNCHACSTGYKHLLRSCTL